MKKQAGYSVVETILMLVLLAILSFTIWYVFHSRSTINTSYNSANNSAQSLGNASQAASACALVMSLGQKTGAAGTFHQDLIFTNRGNGDCSLNGYPTVLLTDSKGVQIGQPADKDTTIAALTVTVGANQTAHATISLPNSDIAPNCSTNQSAFFKVTLPSDNTTFKAANVDRYCPGFMVTAIQPGS